VKFKLLFACCLLGFGNNAFAENGCPDGMTPFQNGNDPTPKCYPIQDGQSAAPTQPRGRWLTRWGAIATDKVNGFFGAVTDYANKRDAKKAAIGQCKTNGGSLCEFRLAYYNQCAVIAWGDSSLSIQGKETVKAASELALPQCSKASNNCKIVYADCSLPLWVQ